MGVAKSLGAYADIAAILETVLRHEQFPALVECHSTAEAHAWRHRAHAYRVRLRKQEEKDLIIPRDTGSSIYDSWVFKVKDSSVEITKREGVSLVIGTTEVQPRRNEELE
jgi:hypothetical protein